MVKETITMVGSDPVRQISPALHQAVNEEMRGDLHQAELASGDHRLVRLVPRLDDTVRGTHTNRQKRRTDHDRIHLPEFGNIRKAIKAEGSRILERGILVRKKDRRGKAPKKDFKPTSGPPRGQGRTNLTVKGLAIANTLSPATVAIRKKTAGQGRRVRKMVLKVKMGPQLDKPPGATGTGFPAP